MDNTEEFRDIEGYEGIYQVSNFGRIKSLARNVPYKNRLKHNLKETIIIPAISDSGYLRVPLVKDKKQSKFFVSVLVACAFLPKIEGKDFVNHIDRNKENNFPSNLEWVSHRENICHIRKEKEYSSRFVGVTYLKKEGKWSSRIYLNRKSVYLGKFDTETEAYDARVSFEKENKISNKYL